MKTALTPFSCCLSLYDIDAFLASIHLLKHNNPLFILLIKDS